MTTITPGSYSHIIQPEVLDSTFKQVDASIQDMVEIEKEISGAYGDRAELVKAVKQLEGDVKLEEASAFMRIGVDNTVDIDGNKVKLANAEMRDMYRRHVSREKRQQLIEKEAELARIDCQISLVKDRWDILKQTTNQLEAKAWAQGHLLKFLSNKG